tara:strand:- start:40867 stop:41184 length:318 start_codon:yes stop_codon:yes gene_type:complete
MKKQLKRPVGLLAVMITMSSFFVACGNKQKNKEEITVSYTNPLPVKYGDPFILKASDGKYYMYGTDGSTPGFKVYQSDSLSEWKYIKMAYEGAREDSWTKLLLGS